MAAEVRILTTQLAGGRGADEWERRTVERDVAVADVKAGFAQMLSTLHEVFFQTLAEKEDMLLDEIHVAVDIDASGSFRLVSGDAGVRSGGVNLVLRRRRKEETADVQEHHLNTPHDALKLAGHSGKSPVEIVGPGGSPIPVNLSGQVNPAPGVLTVNVI